jgi:hypothetical protein
MPLMTSIAKEKGKTMRKTFMVDQVSVKEKVEGFKYKARYPIALLIVLVTTLGLMCAMVLK